MHDEPGWTVLSPEEQCWTPYASGNSPTQIVLAEDNPADVVLVCEALREHDIPCDLHIISDGAEVLALIDRLDADGNLRCPNLLLLDIYLPKCDGFEVLNHLRASQRCHRTPVVIFASPDSIPAARKTNNPAPLHYFPKPHSFDEFIKLGSVIKQAIAEVKPHLCLNDRGTDDVSIFIAHAFGDTRFAG